MNYKNVAIFLLVTNIATLAYLAFKTTSNTGESFTNPYPLIDPARSIVAQEHFFSTIEPARKKLKAIVAEYEKEGTKIGLYFEFLNTGANVSINQDARFWPASLSKMPTAMVVMKKIEKGEWKLSNELVLFEEDKDERFGQLYKQPVGTRFTIESLLKEILINSDNTAHRMLVRNLSSNEYTDVFEALGMEELFDKDYNITAKEYSRIFRSLYNASYLDREHAQQLLTWLSETSFKEYLESGLPDDAVFAHKIGEEESEKVFLDSGIAYVPNRPYLITVMINSTDTGGKQKATEIMQKISKEIYQYVENN